MLSAKSSLDHIQQNYYSLEFPEQNILCHINMDTLS